MPPLHLIFAPIGFLARTMAAEVYSIPEFSRAIHENLFADIGRLPNFRLRMLIRHFARYYVTHCPPGAAQDNVLLPFMNYFSTHLYQRINAKWEALAEQKLQEPGEFDAPAVSTTRLYLSCYNNDKMYKNGR